MTEAHTTIGVLRKTYGQTFAPEFRNDDTVSSLLQSTGTASVDEYLEHSSRGRLFVGSSSDIANTIVSRTTATLAAVLVKNFAGTLPSPSYEDRICRLSEKTGLASTIRFGFRLRWAAMRPALKSRSIRPTPLPRAARPQR